MAKDLDPSSLFELGIGSLDRQSPRRAEPVYYRDVLQRVLDQSTNSPAAKNQVQLGRITQDMFDDFGGLAHQFGIERPRSVEVRINDKLPALSSHFDFDIVDNPSETKRIRKIIQDNINPAGKYALTHPEWRSAARALEPHMNEGLHLLLNLGVGAAKKPVLHRVNMRDAIVTALWMEGLITAPDSASFTAAANRKALAEPTARMLVAGQKRAESAFGVGGRELAKALPIVENLAASVGLRGSGSRPLSPKLFRPGGTFDPLSWIPRRDLRAESNRESGVDRKLVHADPKLRFNLMMERLTSAMPPEDLATLLKVVPNNSDELRYGAALIGALEDSRIRSEFGGRDYTKLAVQLTDVFAPQRTTASTQVVTNFTKAAVAGGHASTEEALQTLQRVARRMPGVAPGLTSGGGKTALILALAGMISTGLLVAAGSSKEAA